MRYEVIIDAGETPNKCTIAPLAYRRDFHLIPGAGKQQLGPLQSSILLHHQGPCITTVSHALSEIRGIACIDCVWRRLDTLYQRIEGPLPLLARIPDGFQTAYPRTSIKNTDPVGGLATIEAIFVAAALLGNWDVSLFSEYYFGRKFVELNAQKFLDLGVEQAVQPQHLPLFSSRPRNSMQRRHDRSRLFGTSGLPFHPVRSASPE